jgi:hypothetical protein
VKRELIMQGAAQMAFVIVRTTDIDKTAIRHRTPLPNAKTHAEASAVVELEVKKYKEYGKDEEQGMWWARNESGEQFRFWIEGE